MVQGAKLPFIQQVSAHIPGEELVVTCQLDLHEHLFLHDHTLGCGISQLDPDLLALPIVPLTVSMEMMAEAANTLLPDLKLIGMCNVRAYRWILLEDEAITIQIVAKRIWTEIDSHSEDQDVVRVAVKVYLADAEGNQNSTPILEGTMRLAAEYPVAPLPAQPLLHGERPSRCADSELYTKGMFHGPAFQAVRSMDKWAEDGVVATLETLPVGALFASNREPTFVAEPVVMDAAGQVIGFWALEHPRDDIVVFPYSVERLDFYTCPEKSRTTSQKAEMEQNFSGGLYRPALPPGQQLECRAQIEFLDEHRISSDIDLIAQNGQLCIRVTGWADRIFDLPSRLYRFILEPATERLSIISQVGSEELNGVTHHSRTLNTIAPKFFEAHSGFWEKVLANLVLNQTERQQWKRLLNRPTQQYPAADRIEWLFGRLVAKETVAALLQAEFQLLLCPADIEIVVDEQNRPRAQGAWMQQVKQPISLSFSCIDGAATAVAELREFELTNDNVAI